MATLTEPPAPSTPRRITRVVSNPHEVPLSLANRLATRFSIPGPLEAYDFPEKGNINLHTFVILSGRADGRSEFLLQRINDQVFTRPRSVMKSMIACIEAQRSGLARGGIGRDLEWEAITLVPTRDGDPYLEPTDRRGSSCWRLMVRIPEARTYKSLGEIREPAERLRIAEEAGRGLATYGDLTAGMDVSTLESPLPGYRDTRVYFAQLHSVLARSETSEQAETYLPRDPVVRQSTEQHFLVHLPESEYRRRMDDPEIRKMVALALGHEAFGMTLLDEMDSGRIRRLAIHGDTKLDNFLFSTRTGKVKAMVDLDTIMPHTWLADWGDMVRSLVNVAGEKERDLDKVQVDMAVLEAVARGFLGSARSVTDHEVGRMVDAVQIIALELGVRFLSDHLRGDSYFKLGQADPPDLNRVRALVQLTLFERLRARGDEVRKLVERLWNGRGAQRTGGRR